MTEDRLIHGLAALPLVALYVYAFRRSLRATGYFSVLAFALLGSWVPDWDLILGIGFHRSPLTHSALPAIAFGYLALKWNWRNTIAGFALGVASHLFLDTVDYGNVIGIPGGTADRMYLMANGIVLLVGAFAIARRLPGHDRVQTRIEPDKPETTTNDKNKDRFRPKSNKKVMTNREMKKAPEGVSEVSKTTGETMTTKVTILGCAILLVCYFLAAAVANGDETDDAIEIAATCGAYTADIASLGHSEYVSETVWWHSFLYTLLDRDKERTDVESSLAEKQIERAPTVEDDDYIEAIKSRDARLLRVAKLCRFIRAEFAGMSD